MAILEDKRATLRKTVLPAAASLVGAGLGLVLTKKPNVADALPDRGHLGVGDLADDLRSKLDSVLDKLPASARSVQTSVTRRASTLGSDEFERRRRDREERRKQRRARR